MYDLVIQTLSLTLWPIAASIGVYCAYRNGVNDGYGYSQEPWNPGYRKAGDWLVKNAAGRWPQLLTYSSASLVEKPILPEGKIRKEHET